MNYYPPEVALSLVGGTLPSLNSTTVTINRAKGRVPGAIVKLDGLSTHSSSSHF